MSDRQAKPATSRRSLIRLATAAAGGAAMASLAAHAADTAPKAAGPGVRDRILGSWRMIDWKILKGEKSLPPPLGPADQCGGLLIYSPDGMMSAFLSAKSRPRFKDNSLDGGTPEEKLRAFESVIAYTGSFAVDEATATVTHDVKYATLPNFVSQKLPRICVFDGDTLKLDTPPMQFGGESLASYILWQRT